MITKNLKHSPSDKYIQMQYIFICVRVLGYEHTGSIHTIRHNIIIL